jgi:signal transduction histidine kinase
VNPAPTARSLDNPAVKLAIALPSVAAFAYGLATARVVHLELFLVLVSAALLLAVVAAARPWRGPRAEEMERTWQLLSGTVGVALAFPLLVAALDTDVERFSLLFALVVVVGAYSYPERWRAPLSSWVLVVWGLTLWFGGVDDLDRLALHLGGGVLVLATSIRTADALAAAVALERTSREEAELRASLLSSVLRTNSLEPAAVLDAVVTGLERSGFDAVAIREHDPDLHTLRLVVGSAGMDELGLPPELPVERGGLSGIALESGEPVAVDDYASHPAAIQPERPLRGVIAVPVCAGDGQRAVVLGARRDGPVGPAQREAILLLSALASRALERARRYEADQRTVEQLQALDVRTQDFISTVSHELRTPLTVIQGLGQTLPRRWEELGERRRADLLTRIDANAERLAAMVRSLLDTSALEEGRLEVRPERVVLRASIERLLHRLATVTAAHPVAVDIAPDLEVVADPGLLEHVVENLLTNVAKHTPQGTNVEVVACRVGDRVRIEMRDDGPGIPPEDLPHVLDRFFRGGAPTRRPSGGLGLGLALARQIVQAHGGELTVRSAPGEGTTFRFDLPGVSGAVARPSAGSPLPPR